MVTVAIDIDELRAGRIESSKEGKLMLPPVHINDRKGVDLPRESFRAKRLILRQNANRHSAGGRAGRQPQED
jgi:hypothetical protein